VIREADTSSISRFYGGSKVSRLGWGGSGLGPFASAVKGRREQKKTNPKKKTTPQKTKLHKLVKAFYQLLKPRGGSGSKRGTETPAKVEGSKSRNFYYFRRIGARSRSGKVR